MISSEQEYEYHLQLVGNDFCENGHIKPAAYQNMIQNVAESHLLGLTLDTNAMLARNLAWVLVGMTIVPKRPPKTCIPLTGRTWHSETKGPYYRREFIFYDTNGSEVFCGASFSVLLNVQDRRIVRRFDLPGVLGEGSGQFVMDRVRPNFKSDAKYAPYEDLTVRSSHIDILGHVNNTRYCEFAFDTLTESQKAREITRIAVNFVCELRLSDEISILKAEEEQAIYVRGVRKSDGKTSFDVAFYYDTLA